MKPMKPNAMIPARKQVPAAVTSGLTTAAELLRRSKHREAIEHLELLHAQFPRIEEPLMALADVYQQAGDTFNLLRALSKLHELRPNDPELTLGLAGINLLEIHPALAVTTFQEFLRRWPDHPEAPETRKSVTTLLEDLTPKWAEMGLLHEGAVDKALTLSVLHERLQMLTNEGRFTEGRRTAEHLLRQRPGFVPVLNDLSLIYLGG